MQDQQPTCIECQRKATHIVSVPWIHATTKETGSDWTPVCKSCLRGCEDWPRFEFARMLPETVAILAETLPTSSSLASN